MTLRAKLVAVFVGVTLCSGALTLWLTRASISRILFDYLAENGFSEANLEASVTAAGFEAGSEKMLMPHLLRLQSVTSAVYVMAIDPKGVILAHTDVSQQGRRVTDGFAEKVLKARVPLSHMYSTDGRPLLELAVPVWSTTAADEGEQFLFRSGPSREHATHGRWLGAIRLALPLQGSMNTQSRIVQQLIVIMLIVTAAGIMAAWMLIRGVLWPIGRILRGTEQIAEGSYGIEIPASSKDELGNLAHSFNRMSKVLADTTVSKNFLRDILSNMSDALMFLAADGTIRMVNQTMIKLLGYAENELVGQPATVLFDHPPRWPMDVAQNIELDLRTKGGASIPVLFSSAFLTNDAGEMTGIIATAKDMTERKRLENAMRQSEKMSAVGQLAAGVAHEINNPLGVILGFAEGVALDLKPDDPLTLPLKSIEREALRCRNLVQDLLVFSRASKSDSEPLNMNFAVDSALSLISAQSRVTGVHIQKELAADLPDILGNLNQVQQVIINLANNAIDSMKGSNGVLTIKTDLFKEKSLSWVCLRILDTGPGIPPELVSRIFEPFFTTKPVGQGTGLGLSLVHEIVKRHSGSVDLESRPGRTEFCIKFPVP